LHSELPENKVSKGAFSQARQKLKHEAFIELDKDQIDYFYDTTDYKKWNGFRLIAIDGSTSRLPNSEAIIEEYGVADISETSTPIILSRLSQAYDMLNHLTIDAQFSSYHNNEHEMAVNHLSFLKSNDICLFDRNYASFWLFALLNSKGIHFCARLKTGSWKVAKQLVDNGQREITEEIYPSKASAKRCKALGIVCKVQRLRFICIELVSGEKEVLVTNLMDEKEFSYDEFADLYHLRWFVEESYKRMKSRLEIENYSGKNPLALLQDFYAKLFSCNLTSILMSETDQQVEIITKNRKYNYQLNFTQALNRMKNSIVLLFIRSEQKIKEYVTHLENLFISNLELIRPDRYIERKFRKSKRIYPVPYKNSF
jgi:hypothetical protein